MTRRLVIGASGLIGSALLRAAGPDAVGTFRSRARRGLRPLDAADRDALARLIAEIGAEQILFPAAEPNVEWCEAHAAEAEERNLAPLRAALASGLPVIAFSSDYVFDGAAGPYDEDARPEPLSVYGRIKLALEVEAQGSGAAVVRTTGVFGLEAEPRNFVLRLVASLRAGQPVRVPFDQVATPTYAEDLAKATICIADREPRGVWHVAGRDLVSRTELAHRAARAFGLDGRLISPVATAELGQRALRPLRGGLACRRYERSFGEHPGRPLNSALADLAASVLSATGA